MTRGRYIRDRTLGVVLLEEFGGKKKRKGILGKGNCRLGAERRELAGPHRAL